MPGLRPDKVVKLYQELGIESLAELEAAAKAGRLKAVKGLGAALQTKILQNIEIGRSGAGRLSPPPTTWRPPPSTSAPW